MNWGSREITKDLALGRWNALYHRLAASTIFGTWRNPYENENPHATSLHTLVGRDRFAMSCWMLASWFHATQANWHIVVHDDGTLPAEAWDVLRRMGVECEVFFRAEADLKVEAALAGLPLCLEHRRRSPLALKLYDVHVLSHDDRFILLDSDLLFFRRPHEIIDWCNGPDSGCWFMQDVAEANQVSKDEAKRRFGIDLWSRVNTGIVLWERNTVALPRIEEYLKAFNLLSRNLWMVEQTLYALAASERKNGGILPPQYELSFNVRAAPDVIVRHYAGAVRHLFYSEGLGIMRREIMGDKRRRQK